MEKFKIADINQDVLPPDLHKGACYGITYAMADPNLRPYAPQNHGKQFFLNHKIFEYQRNQHDEQKDQGKLKRTRLTRKFFCIDPSQQAKAIITIAFQYLDKNLCLERYHSTIAHACYLSIRKNHTIRYMDPNHGAYLFNHLADFIAFYILTAEQSEIPYIRYQLAELVFDNHLKREPLKTLNGKWRSLLTGRKYPASDSFVSSLLYELMILSLIIQILSWACYSRHPSLCKILGGTLFTLAKLNGYSGLLGVPQYLQEKNHTFWNSKSPTLFSFNPTHAHPAHQQLKHDQPVDLQKDHFLTPQGSN